VQSLARTEVKADDVASKTAGRATRALDVNRMIASIKGGKRECGGCRKDVKVV
jgi:hypothetical protein